MGSRGLRLFGVFCGVVLCCLVFCGVGFAGVGWWHVLSGSRPSVLQVGSARDEVQELRVAATSGEVVVANLTAQEIEEEVGELKFVKFPFNASAAVVQASLEGLYGAGSVVVSGGPGDAAGSSPYVVRFVGGLADQPVKLMNTGFSHLLGLVGEATAGEGVVGRADGELVLTAENLGDGVIDGSRRAVVLRDVLPAGWRAIGVRGTKPEAGGFVNVRASMPCELASGSLVLCSFTGGLPPFDQLEVRISVVADEPSPGEKNEAVVSGGEVGEVSVAKQIVTGSSTSFGLEDYELVHEEEGGGVDRRAGSHPFQQTTTVALNQGRDEAPLSSDRAVVSPAELPKDLNFRWPPGLIGNPTVFPRCTIGQFLHIVEGRENECPVGSAVGVAVATVYEPGTLHGTLTFTVPLFNLEPAPGEPARVGFYVIPGNAPVFIDTAVRSGDDYGITVSSNNITQTAAFLSAQVTVWGVPGDSAHDGQRSWGCLAIARGANQHGPCNALEQSHPPPFLALPTSCTGVSHSTVDGDTWTDPGNFQALADITLPALDGCNQLPFSPTIKVSPDSQEAAKPTGLTVGIHVPQEESLNPGGLAESSLKDATVTLPAGVTTNPAGADGLEACSEDQIGYLPAASIPPRELHFTGSIPGPSLFCPDASKIATARIKTPVLTNALEGAVYLAAQNANPFGSLVAMYIVAEDLVSGVLVKLPGEVSLDGISGQITTAFLNSPQAPLEDAEFHFFGGERAPLATPFFCGSYTTTSSLTPWSGNPPSTPSSTFNITSGPNGAPCQNSLPFHPSLTGGMANVQAGAFSPFTTTISRTDGQQSIQVVRLHMPAGVSGMLSNVKLCGETQANSGTCGPESLIGETTVSVGVGGSPFSVKGGRVYITGPYQGAPFGLSIVNPAKAGPFDLEQDTPCDCVVVRAKIDVDPHTAELTVRTDSEGPYKIPTIIKGIPLQIQHINVNINRERFTFNPTNCNPKPITGSILSTEGTNLDLTVPFQITNCGTLKFKPDFKVSTTGKTSKLNGASLVTKIVMPPTPPGGQATTSAGVASVKVALPKQLVSRLTTLQKACLAATFEANPASCPPQSIVGHARVLTPLLPVPLTGPAYFVSHGGEAFPSLTMVLQGYGVTVQIVGATFIKNGITTSTFRSTPDVPFNTFELTLPQGPFSALAANGSLCQAKQLAMPTAFTAQNGTTIHQTTKIPVTNCPKKHKPHKTKHKHTKHKK